MCKTIERTTKCVIFNKNLIEEFSVYVGQKVQLHGNMPPKKKRGQRKPKRNGGSSGVGRFYSPSEDPPVIKEIKWRKAFLKWNTVEATDMGHIEEVTALKLREELTAQQRVPPPLTGEKMLIRVKSIIGYGLPGIGDAGKQTSPSVKIRAYPLNQLNQLALSWAQDEAEDAGSLDSNARIGYHWPAWQTQQLLLGDSTAAIAVVESYRTSRGYVYCSLEYAYAEE